MGISDGFPRLARFVLVAVLGGIAFWFPNLLLRLLWVYLLQDRNVPDKTLIILITITLPFISMRVFRTFAGHERSGTWGTITAFFVIFGIWVLGPLFLMMDASLSGGGFAVPGWRASLELMTVLFPVFTFIMSAYDGSLLALLIATICLMIAAYRRRPMERPA